MTTARIAARASTTAIEKYVCRGVIGGRPGRVRVLQMPAAKGIVNGFPALDTPDEGSSMRRLFPQFWRQDRSTKGSDDGFRVRHRPRVRGRGGRLRAGRDHRLSIGRSEDPERGKGVHLRVR